MTGKRGGRELALHLLYQMEVRTETLDQILPEALEFFQPTPDDRSFAVRLVEYALADKQATEELLKSNATNWDPTRFAVIDLCILRLAISEMTRVAETPTTKILNEAIELAKSYSTPKSGGFVNGVLDPIARLVRGDVKPKKGESA